MSENKLRARIALEVGRVVTDVSNWPSPVSAHMLGRDLAEPIDKITEALLPVIREAKAEALEEAAENIHEIDGREDTMARRWLRARANQYKEEPTDGR